MASTSETGHAKNLGNFAHLINILKEYPTYAPVKAELQIPELESLKDAAVNAFQTLQALKANYTIAVNKRQETYSDLKTLTTRIVNIFDSSEATDALVKDLRTLQRKIHGKRAAQPSIPLDPDAPPPNSISVSQQSYIKLADTFGEIIALIAAEPSYMPNEIAVQVTTLQDKLSKMITDNSTVSTAFAQLDNARINRNNLLYHPATGIAHQASEVKKYIKGLFGASSQQYQTQNSLPIVN